MSRWRTTMLLAALTAALLGAGLLGAPAPARAEGTLISTVAAGYWHTCAVTNAGGAKCWGYNAQFVVGNEPYGGLVRTPVDVCASGADPPCREAEGETLTSVTAVAAGDYHVCALMTTGGVKCWGADNLGQLGGKESDLCADPFSIGINPVIPCAATPVDVVGLTTGVADLDAGWLHTCAVTTGGVAKCWGNDTWGQLGAETTEECKVPEPLRGAVRPLGRGPISPMAGPTPYTEPCSATPLDVFGLQGGMAAVGVGAMHSCVVTAAGGVKCWGWNLGGQLGDGTLTDRDMPVDVCADAACEEPLGEVVDVAAGFAHTCSLMAEGGVKCWGNNQFGQLGDGGRCGLVCLPVDVCADETCAAPLTGVVAISVGPWHTCALTTEGGVKCWGYNSSGQLGDGTQTRRFTPVDVVGLSEGATALAAGGNPGGSHTCAVTKAGGVKCWGSNFWAQLGNGSSDTAAHVTPLETRLDWDGDGCADARERSANPALGGLRSAKNVWDFFDTPEASNLRDGRLAVGDIFRLITRFGTNGDPSVDPLSPPPSTGYHPAFDRSPPPDPSRPWAPGPADGRIITGDLLLMTLQFGHTCR